MIALQSYLRRLPKCMYHPNFAPSLGLFNPCFTFSDAADGKKKWDEDSDLVQRGLIARSIIQFISQQMLFYQTERKTLRQKIIDEAFMKAYIYRNIEENESSQVEKIKSEWLENERFSFNFSKVVRGFHHKFGYQVKRQIWVQNRMLDAQQRRRRLTILNPLSFTGIYFQILKSANNCIVSGTKGIGKSFSFVSYECLSSFIHGLPLSLQQQQKNISNHVFNQGIQIQRNLGRMIYLSAKNDMDYGKYFKQIIHQLNGIYQKKDILKDTKVKADKQNNYQVHFEEMESFFKDVKGKLVERNINFIVVFDQANKLLSLVRKLYQQMKQCQVESKLAQNDKQQIKVRYRKSTTYKELKQYSKFIKIIYQTFENILFHSSQEHEKKYISQFPKQDRDNIQLLKILSESRTMSKQIISYGDTMQQNNGQIQIYEIYYFQISCLLSLTLSRQSIQKLRIIFQNTFYKNKSIEKWRNGVRFLQIRQVVRGNNKLKKQFLQLLRYQSYNQGFQKVSELLKTTKQSIQKLRLEQLIQQNIFEIYLLKAGSSVDALERHSIISNLSIELRKYSQDNKMLPQPNQFIFKNPNISKKNKFALCQTLSFAYVDDNSHIVFQIQPSKLRELLSKIKADQKYNQTLSAIVNVVWADDNFNHEFGRMLDNLSIDCFKNTQFTITIKDEKQNKHLFACIDSVPFIGLHNFSQESKEALTNFQALIKRANELKGSYVGGYPVKRDTNGQFDSTSEMFDNIIVKMKEKKFTTKKISRIKIQYEIIVLDWTFGNVNKKIIPKMDKKIQNFFRLTKIQGDVNMTFYLAAPEYQVDRYHQQQKKMPINMIKKLPNKKFNYNFAYKLASYDKNLPFECNNDEISNISYKLIETLYKRNQKLSKQKIQINKNLINSSKSRK